MESVRNNEPVGTRRERRRCVRQKVHTPAYVTLDKSSNRMDLSEILDISEEGVAIQTSAPPELHHDVDLCLDLSETKARIQATGQVVRLDRSGRAAIAFPEMPEPSRQQLREWLFLNAVMASINRDTLLSEPLPDLDQDDTPSDFTSRLIGLAAVDREVLALGSDLNASLELIAQRAQAFTAGSGAAIALSRDGEIVCVARAGSHAPPFQARLQAGSGFSGECIRTGKLLRCDDAERDSRVDQESCRALGIRSMMAAPIYEGNSVVGLLEVFSAKPDSFAADAETVLKHFSETIAKAIKRQKEVSAPIEAAISEGIQAPESWVSSHRALLIAIAAVLLTLAVVMLVAPWKTGSTRMPGAIASQPSSNSSSKPSPAPRKPSPSGVDDLQSLLAVAEQGDPSAQFAVGARYATGHETKQDYAEAIHWFTKAAEQGHVVSQATLGAYYWAGRGVAPDLEKAYYWSVLAQSGGDQASKYRMAVLASRLTPSQVAAVQQRANDWIKQHPSLSQAALRERQ